MSSPNEVTEYYITIIQQLEELINVHQDKLFELHEDKVFHDENDVRLSYYHYSIQHIDATIHLLMYNTSLSLDINQLIPYYNGYKIKNRFNNHEKKIIPFSSNRQNMYQFIANHYSFSIYSNFEYIIRCISMKIYEHFYHNCSNKVIDLVTKIMSKSIDEDDFNKNTRYRLINYNRIRNAVHNNGVFYPTDVNQKDKKISFEFVKGDPVYFIYGKPISGSNPWTTHLKMTEDLFSLYDQIISIPNIRSYPYIPDPSIQKL